MEEFRRNEPDSFCDGFDCDRSHVFRLCLRVTFQSGIGRPQQHLERVDAVGIRCCRYNSYDPSAEPLGGAIGSVSARPLIPGILVGGTRLGSPQKADGLLHCGRTRRKALGAGATVEKVHFRFRKAYAHFRTLIPRLTAIVE